MLFAILYNTVFYVLRKILIPFLSLVLPKLRTRNRDAQYIFNQIHFDNANARTIWFHAASMGEFEQAKPVIELIKAEHPNIKIIVTFYSPSGYQNQKNYPFADAVLYLPDDSLRRVNAFYDKFNPDIAVFVRYDFWFNYLRIAKKRNIPLYLIAATKPDSILSQFFLFSSINRLYYSHFKAIFTVGDIHSDYFKTINPSTEVITCSDPRFDRIIKAVEYSKSNPIISKDKLNDAFTLVLGSSWSNDEDIFIAAINKFNADAFKIRCIFVPHEPTEEHLRALCEKIDCIKLSNYIASAQTKEIKQKHIVVDSIGKLLGIYALADAAYIGGGFGAGVHSVAEPAGYSIPLACGPNISGSHDARNLHKLGALTIIRNESESLGWLNGISDNNKSNSVATIAANYINSNSGSSELIANSILK